jgi:glucokinase
MKALAVDLGGTHATCGLVDGRNILGYESIDTDRARSLQAVLPVFADSFRRLLKHSSLEFSDCGGVAIGFAGLVDSRAGKVVSTNQKYEDATSIDIPAWSWETFGLPLRIENDARLALLGECFGGAAKGYSDAVMMTLGTGIGGVAMIEGKLLRGKHAQAGCLGGHLPVQFNGRECSCGAIGCAESEASGWALPKVLRDWPGLSTSELAKYPDPGFKEVFDEAAKGDAVATAVRDRCLKVWAVDAVGLVHAYDPEIIVIGGGVMESADVIIPYVESYVQKYAWTPWGKVKVRAAELGNHAALVGAVPLLTEQN